MFYYVYFVRDLEKIKWCNEKMTKNVAVLLFVASKQFGMLITINLLPVSHLTFYVCLQRCVSGLITGRTRWTRRRTLTKAAATTDTRSSTDSTRSAEAATDSTSSSTTTNLPQTYVISVFSYPELAHTCWINQPRAHGPMGLQRWSDGLICV